MTETAQPSATGSGGRRIAILASICILLIVGAGAGGYVAGRESAGADALRRQLASARGEASRAQERVSSLERDNSELEDEVEEVRAQVEDLEESVEAANNLKGSATVSDDEAVAAPAGSRRLGVAASVGDLVLRPTAFDRTGEAGGAANYVVTITAKNDGAEPVSIFCGGGGASMTDTQGRSFDGESVLADDTANCGDDLGPGLTATYKMKFKAPAAAKPSHVTLWDSSDFGDAEDGSVDWVVR